MEQEQQKRRKFSADFKREAVRLVTEKGVSIAQAARDLELSESLLSKWKHQSQIVQGAPALPVASDGELTRLRREVEVLRQEREILKKAVGIFSQLPR